MDKFVVLFLSIIGVGIFKYAISIINKHEKSNLEIKRLGIIYIIMFISTTILYNQYWYSIEFIFFFYLSIYLLLSAYVDFKTMYVYSAFNYITIIISIIYLIIKSQNLNVTSIGVNVIIYLVFSVILTKFSVYGEGDNEIFIAIALFIGVKYSNFALGALLLNTIVSNIIAVLLNFKSINFKKGKFNKKIAFAPAIAISTMILLLL